VLTNVLRTGEPAYVPDAGASSPVGPFPNVLRAGFRALAVAPLRMGGETLGVLAVGYPEKRTLSAAERELLDLFAAHGAALVERARRVYAERRRADQQERLAAVLAALAAVADLDEALSTLVRGVVALLDGVQGTARIYTHAPTHSDAASGVSAASSSPEQPGETGEQAFLVILHQNGSLEVSRTPQRLRGGSFAAALYAGGPAALVEDAWTLDPAVYPHAGTVRREGIRSSVNVPIEAGGRRIGSLHVDHLQPAFFSHEDLLLAQTLAAQAGAAIERVRTEETRRAASAGQARLDGALLVARTVAHEINNAISPVLGFAELLALRPSVVADPSAMAYTTHITAAAQETAAKIRRLQHIVRLEQADSPLGESIPVLDLERSSREDAAR